LYFDNFEHGFEQWAGPKGGEVHRQLLIVDDPLGQRGKVLKAYQGDMFSGLNSGSFPDAFIYSKAFVQCTFENPCEISFWALGSPYQGFSVNYSDKYVWTASRRFLPVMHILTSEDTARWNFYWYQFPSSKANLSSPNWDGDIGDGIFRLLLSGHNDKGHNTYFDDIKVVGARVPDREDCNGSSGVIRGYGRSEIKLSNKQKKKGDCFACKKVCRIKGGKFFQYRVRKCMCFGSGKLKKMAKSRFISGSTEKRPK